jgi:hypothetical protein
MSEIYNTTQGPVYDFSVALKQSVESNLQAIESRLIETLDFEGAHREVVALIDKIDDAVKLRKA